MESALAGDAGRGVGALEAAADGGEAGRAGAPAEEVAERAGGADREGGAAPATGEGGSTRYAERGAVQEEFLKALGAGACVGAGGAAVEAGGAGTPAGVEAKGAEGAGGGVVTVLAAGDERKAGDALLGAVEGEGALAHLAVGRVEAAAAVGQGGGAGQAGGGREEEAVNEVAGQAARGVASETALRERAAGKAGGGGRVEVEALQALGAVGGG